MRRQRRAVVIDTDVPVVANARTSGVMADLTEKCRTELHAVKTSGLLVLDADGEIMDQYRANLHASGQPGPGDAFFLWAFVNQANPTICEQVCLHRRSANPGDYVEFPTIPELQSFDRSDRVFVSVALGSRHKPVVVSAIDSDWAHHAKALQRAGVRLRYLATAESRKPQSR